MMPKHSSPRFTKRLIKQQKRASSQKIKRRASNRAPQNSFLRVRRNRSGKHNNPRLLEGGGYLCIRDLRSESSASDSPVFTFTSSSQKRRMSRGNKESGIVRTTADVFFATKG